MSRAAGNGLLVVVALLGLAACEKAPYVAPETSRLMGAPDALALPPPGGPAVVAVVERRFSNARAQEIALATRGGTPGQNQISVAVLGTGRPRGDDVMLTPAFTDEAIAVEMRAALPGVAMTISPFFASNVYGPYGYAFGRGAGSDLCLYGWQRIDSTPRPLARSRVISARMRLCESGATEASLLANMQGYTLHVPLGAYFHAARPSGTAAPGGGLRHVETVLGTPAPAPAPRARQQAPALARAEPPAAPVPVMPPTVAPPAVAPPLPPAILQAVPPAVAPPPAPSVAAPVVPPPPLETAPLPPAPPPSPTPSTPTAPMVEAPHPVPPPPAPPAPTLAGVASAAILPEIAE